MVLLQAAMANWLAVGCFLSTSSPTDFLLFGCLWLFTTTFPSISKAQSIEDKKRQSGVAGFSAHCKLGYSLRQDHKINDDQLMDTRLNSCLPVCKLQVVLTMISILIIPSPLSRYRPDSWFDIHTLRVRSVQSFNSNFFYAFLAIIT